MLLLIFSIFVILTRASQAMLRKAKVNLTELCLLCIGIYFVCKNLEELSYILQSKETEEYPLIIKKSVGKLGQTYDRYSPIIFLSGSENSGVQIVKDYVAKHEEVQTCISQKMVTEMARVSMPHLFLQRAKYVDSQAGIGQLLIKGLNYF